jgi:hypothetical protein
MPRRLHLARRAAHPRPPTTAALPPPLDPQVQAIVTWAAVQNLKAAAGMNLTTEPIALGWISHTLPSGRGQDCADMEFRAAADLAADPGVRCVPDKQAEHYDPYAAGEQTTFTGPGTSFSSSGGRR